jgi:hypothetical protein
VYLQPLRLLLPLRSVVGMGSAFCFEFRTILKVLGPADAGPDCFGPKTLDSG